MGTKPTYLEARYNMAKHVIINIGRQFGSQGREIADEIGRMLGIPVYDDELLAKAAEDSGFSATLFEKRDEKRRFWKVGNIFGANRYGGFSNAGINDGDLFRIQSDAIRRIASEGSAIFIGRASNYVLRDREDCLDVFIHAPMDIRKAYVAQREGIPEDKAEDFVFKKDRGRAEYYNFFTFGHWGKSSDYDLCIDSSLLGVRGTAEFIVNFGRKAGLID